MPEQIIRADGIHLCAESFGEPSDPPLLLIMGASSSMLWWPEDFCRKLAAGRRYVIRYDNRDTGRSITYPPGKLGYSLDDLADDSVRVLDAYGIRRAHIAGMSLGGLIAQLVALKHPARVLTVTLMMTNPLIWPDNDLPGVDEKILAYHRCAATVDWSDRKAATDYMVNGWRLLSGPAHPFEESAIRAIAEAEAERADNLLSMFNHALLVGGESWFDRFGEIAAPALVIHGTDDPVLPYPYGLALAHGIPGAKLVTLPGTGHELHRADWDAISAAILEHTERS